MASLPTVKLSHEKKDGVARERPDKRRRDEHEIPAEGEVDDLAQGIDKREEDLKEFASNAYLKRIAELEGEKKASAADRATLMDAIDELKRAAVQDHKKCEENRQLRDAAIKSRDRYRTALGTAVKHLTGDKMDGNMFSPSLAPAKMSKIIDSATATLVTALTTPD
jgi:hypothetical protein